MLGFWMLVNALIVVVADDDADDGDWKYLMLSVLFSFYSSLLAIPLQQRKNGEPDLDVLDTDLDLKQIGVAEPLFGQWL